MGAMLADATVQGLAAARRPPSEEPRWLSAGRAAALRRFMELGLPTPRDEDWRFTDLRPLRTALAPGAGAAAPSTSGMTLHRLSQATDRLVFVDGRLDRSSSRLGALPPGAWCTSIIDALATRPDLVAPALAAMDEQGARPFASLNAAQFTDGMLLVLESGIVLERPIELVCLRSTQGGVPVQLRHRIAMGEGSAATVTESALGEGAGSTNDVSVLTLHDRARLAYVKLQTESGSAVHLAELRATLGSAAVLDSVFLTLGARLSRQDIHVALAGESARFTLSGTCLLRGEQEAVFAPFVDHQVANCQTSELFKTVVDDHAHGVFLGTIAVREGADGTEAHQQNRNLLLSPTARADARPELTIYADEVKCSHGATVGDLDDAALFYLQARGLDPVAARAMLIAAFAAEPLDGAALPTGLRDSLRLHLSAWLGTGEIG
ncbi:MAG: Fe-S cluster assembly protein SufD [Dyella sp.]|nr:Fe-S cluster assembly protein SufD [Dyella sp.]